MNRNTRPNGLAWMARVRHMADGGGTGPADLVEPPQANPSTYNDRLKALQDLYKTMPKPEDSQPPASPPPPAQVPSAPPAQVPAVPSLPAHMTADGMYRARPRR